MSPSGSRSSATAPRSLSTTPPPSATIRSSPRCSAGASSASIRSGKRPRARGLRYACAGAIGAAEFISGLPDGYATDVHQKGARLSAGQRLKDVDLDLREGEVLGVGGLQGHGQRELFQALFGIGRARGSVELWGKPLAGQGPRRRLSGRDGIALVPEDRRGQGLLLSKSVGENLTLSVIPRFSRLGLLRSRQERALVDEMMRFLRIKARTPDQIAGTLSGGNQQKVIFGKMLLTEARVLLLYDPTRGVDVGTKGEIFILMRELAAKGYAILFYSSDLPELVHVADRVAVMRDGKVAAILEGEANSEEGILKAAMFANERNG